MSRTSKLRTVGFALLATFFVAPASAGPARFWVSPSPTNPFWSGLALSDTLEIDLFANSQNNIANTKSRLYIWAQPATVSPGVFKQLQNMTLDVISTDPLIDFIDEETLLDNPLNLDDPLKPVERFSAIRDGVTPFPNNQDLELTTLTPSEFSEFGPDEILGLHGFNLTVPVPSPVGVGIGPTCEVGDMCVPTPQGAAWRIGSFGIQSIGMTGDVEIHLQIGEGGMNHLNQAGDAIEPTSDTDVIFSATASSPVYNAGPSGQRQTNDDVAPEVLIHISDQLTGDYDNDTAVDGGDFLSWQRALGGSSLPNRRIGQTGTIGQGDLVAWQANYGKSLDSPASVVSVPEPSGLLLALIGMVGYLYRSPSRLLSPSYPYSFKLIPTQKKEAIRETPGQKTMKISSAYGPSFLLAAMVLFLLPSVCLSAELWWDNGAAVNSSWGTRNNWATNSAGGGTPSASDLENPQLEDTILRFNNDNNNVAQVTQLDGGRRPKGLHFRSTGSVEIKKGITDSRLRIGSQGIVVDNGSPLISAPVSIRQNQPWRVTNSNVELIHAGNTDFEGKTLTITGVGDTTFNGFIQSSTGGTTGGNLIKLGSGTLTLSNPNLGFTGTVEAWEGIIAIHSSDSFGSGTLFHHGAQINFAENNLLVDNTWSLRGGGSVNAIRIKSGRTGTIAGRIQGDADGAITKIGPGLLHLTKSDNWFAGGTNIKDGSLRVNHAGTLNSGQITFQADGATTVTPTLIIDSNDTFSQPFRLNSDAIIDLPAGRSATLSNVISGAGSLRKTGTGTLIITDANTYASGTVVEAGVLQANTTSLQGDVINNGTIVMGENGVSTLESNMSGTGSFSKLGSGTLTFSGANNYTGGTTVFGGSIAGSPASLQGNINVLAGTSAIFTTGGTYSDVILGAGSVHKQGSGTLTLTGVNIYIGATTISGGTLRLGLSNRISDASDVTISGPTSRFELLNTTHETIDSLSGDGTVFLGSGTLTVGATDGTSIFSGVIEGGGKLTKTGAGDLTLNGNNTYTGETSISSGTVFLGGTLDSSKITVSAGATLRLNGNSRIANASEVVVNAGATFNLNGHSETIDSLSSDGSVMLGSGTLHIGSNNSNSTFSGVISGSGGITKIGSEKLRLTGNNDYTGTTALNGGVMQIASPSNIGSGAIHFGGGQLNFTEDALSLPNSITLNPGGGAVRTQAGFSGILSGTISGIGTLEKAGSGKLRLTGDNVYTGTTALNGGVMQIASPSNIGSGAIHFGGGQLNFTEDALSLSNSITLNPGGGAVRTQAGFSGTLSGTISGSGPLTKLGPGRLTVSGSNTTYTGNTSVEEGILSVNGSISGPVTVSPGATLGGSGTIGGNVTGPGRVAPGNSPGILTINGDYTQDADSTLEIEVASYSGTVGSPDWVAGTDHDQLQVTGTATLGGRLEIPVIDPLNSAGGPSLGLPPIDFLTAGSVAGEFSAIVAPGLEEINPNLAVEVEYHAGGARLSFVPIKLDIEFDDTGNDGTPEWPCRLIPHKLRHAELGKPVEYGAA